MSELKPILIKNKKVFHFLIKNKKSFSLSEPSKRKLHLFLSSERLNEDCVKKKRKQKFKTVDNANKKQGVNIRWLIFLFSTIKNHYHKLTKRKKKVDQKFVLNRISFESNLILNVQRSFESKLFRACLVCWKFIQNSHSN